MAAGRHLSARYTCGAFAHHGFAPSGLRLVGLSMGGWTMLEYALAFPSTVKGWC